MSDKAEQGVKAKRTAKNSVFLDLFKDKKYLLELYHTLHPEDMDATEDTLTDVTIENVLTDNLYNDLGFVAGGRLMILIEAQSTWTVNILVRMLLYLAESYHEYFEGTEIDIEVKAKVIYESEKDDIISQYIIFCKVFNEQTKKYGMTKQAVTETIRICKDRNVLKEYLERKETEVVTIMMSLFDDEQIMKSFLKSERHDEAVEIAERMFQQGKLSLEEIAENVPALSYEELRQIEAEVMQLA